VRNHAEATALARNNIVPGPDTGKVYFFYAYTHS